MLMKYAIVLGFMMLLSNCKSTQNTEQADLAGVNDGTAAAKPAIRYPRNGLQDSIGDISKAINNAKFAVYAIQSGIITGLMAKNVCSLRYVQKFSLRNSVKLGSQYGANLIVTTDEVRGSWTLDGFLLNFPGIEAQGKISQFITTGEKISPPALALFHEKNPRLGCALMARSK